MSDAYHAAVASLEQALDQREKHVYAELVEAGRCLVRLRDELIEEERLCGASPGASDELRHLNAIISVVTSAEYPVIGVRLKRVQLALDNLKKLGDPTT